VRNRFAFQPRYFLFWLLFFALTRGVFLLYHARLSQQLPGTTVLGTFVYGLRLDASVAAYMSAIPFLLFIVASLWGPRFPLQRIVSSYTAFIGTMLTLLVTADLELYRAWGFRLDDTPLQYLNSPAEMAASAGSAPVRAAAADAWSPCSAAGWYLYNKVVGPLPGLPPWFGRLRAAFAGLLYLVLLIVPLRGGTQQIPVNQSDVYFSATQFRQPRRLNAPWNLMSALLLRARRNGHLFASWPTAPPGGWWPACTRGLWHPRPRQTLRHCCWQSRGPTCCSSSWRALRQAGGQRGGRGRRHAHPR
jgi:hypothetical protein